AWCTSISNGLIVPRPAGMGSLGLSYARSKTQAVSFTLLSGILSWDKRVDVRIGVALTRRSVSWRLFSKLLLESSSYQILLGPVPLSASSRTLSNVLFRLLSVLFSVDVRCTSV